MTQLMPFENYIKKENRILRAENKMLRQKLITLQRNIEWYKDYCLHLEDEIKSLQESKTLRE